MIVAGLSIAAFVLLLLENKGVASYDDEDDLKFERRHSVSQMRNMMLSLNLGCFVLNVFLARNLAKMVSRANREKGSANCIHTVALAFNLLALLTILAMTVTLYFPTRLEIYRYLQDSYFGLQMLVVSGLLQGTILTQV